MNSLDEPVAIRIGSARSHPAGYRGSGQAPQRLARLARAPLGGRRMGLVVLASENPQR